MTQRHLAVAKHVARLHELVVMGKVQRARGVDEREATRNVEFEQVCLDCVCVRVMSVLLRRVRRKVSCDNKRELGHELRKLGGLNGGWASPRNEGKN